MFSAGASDAEGPEVGLIKWGKANGGYFAYYLDRRCIFLFLVSASWRSDWAGVAGVRGLWGAAQEILLMGREGPFALTER